MSSVIFIHKITKKSHELSYLEIRSQRALQMQQTLKILHDNKKDYEIFCSCNSSARMHTRFNSHKEKVYVATNSGLSKEHKEGCIYYEELKENQIQGVYYPALEIKGPNHIKLSVNHLGILQSNTRKPHKRNNSMNGSGYSRARMTIGSFGRELLSRAWEHAMDNYFNNNYEENGQLKYKYPSIYVMRQSLSSLFIGNPSPHMKVEIKKGSFLQDKLMLGFEKTGRVYIENKKGVNPVILMPFTKDNIKHDYDDQYHLLRLPDSTKNIRELLIDKIEWADITNTNRSRVNYNNHKQYFVIGLGETNTFGKPPILYNAELIPVTSRGMFVDSSYEHILFTLLEEKKRNYIKPNQLLEEMDYLKPDAILRDTYKPFIIEVFGMNESDTEYHEARIKKIKYYESLSEYGFYKWDAYTLKKPERFPTKEYKNKV